MTDFHELIENKVKALKNELTSLVFQISGVLESLTKTVVIMFRLLSENKLKTFNTYLWEAGK